MTSTLRLRHAFDGIYRRNRWNGRESRSGPGSGWWPTREATEFLLLNAGRPLLNIGCGDDLWTPNLPGYLGVDVSPTAIRLARANHPDRSYLVMDGTRQLPPGAWDTVLVRDVLQHLPMEDGLRLLNLLRDAGVRLLIASTYTGDSAHGDRANVDIRSAGDCYAPVLTEPPFSLPRPLRRVRDGWSYEDGKTLRDPAKWLALWDLGGIGAAAR